ALAHENWFSRAGAPPARENRDFPDDWVRAGRPPARENWLARTEKLAL
ncbi:Os09g0293601, partial [Oryza sativa Japonica Group]